MSFGIPVRNGLGLGLLASTTLATQNAFGTPTPTPTLNLDFTTMTALPSTITFSRPSNATYYDSTGKLTYAPNNLLLNSATLSTQNVTTAPINYILSFQGTGSIVRTGTSTGTLTGTGVSNRVFVAFTPTAGTLTLTVAGSVTSAQLEAVTYQTTPGTYNATTSAAYYGARLDYNPATLAARGLLIEEARTNRAFPSNNFLGWTTDNVTVTANQTTSPDGTVSAALLNSGTGTSQHQIFVFSTGFTVGLPFTGSVYAKAGTGRYLTICLIGDTARGGYANFDLIGGNVTQSGALSGGGTFNSASITAVGNGFYRLTVTATSTADSQAYISYATSNTATYVPDAGGRKVYTGTGETYYIWGPQFEQGSFPTSYIPTAGGPVSRSADTASMTGTNFSSWYNATAGAFLVQFDTPASGTRIISAADDNTANNNIQMLTSGTDPTFLVTTSGTAQASIDAGTVAANTVYKFAGTYSANDFAACISGGTVGADTSGTIPTVDRLRIGAGQAGNTLCGHVALLNYYPQRLPNATLQSLTS